MTEKEGGIGNKKKSEAVVRIVKKAAEALGLRKGEIKQGKAPTIEKKTPDVEEKKAGPEVRPAHKAAPQAKPDTKEWSEEVVSGLRRGELPPDLSIETPVVDARATIDRVRSKVDWLIPEGDTPQSEPVAQVVAEIASSRLRDDPDYLLAKGAQLRWSIRPHETPEDVQAEARKYLQRIRQKVLELYEVPDIENIGDIQKLTKNQRETLNVIGHNLSGFESGMVGVPDDSGISQDGVEIKIEDLGTNAEEFLGNLRQATGEMAVSGDIARAARREIFNELKRGKFSEEDAVKLRGLAERLYRFEQTQGAERFSSIYLSSGEVKLILQNPALFFQKRLQVIEAEAADPQSSLFQASINRLRLAGEFFGSENFDASRIITSRDVSQLTRKELLQKIEQYSLSPEKRMLSAYVNSRLDVVFQNAVLTRGGDMKRFGEDMKRIGDRAVNLTEASDGGLVGAWKGRYERTMKNLTRNEHSLFHRRRRIMPADDENAFQITLNEFRQERALHEGRYREWYRQYQSKGTDLPPELELNDVAMESIIRRAQFAFRLKMRKAYVMEQGLNPGEGFWYDGIPSFATESYEETMLAAAHPRDYFIRKWMKKGILRVFNVGARFTAEFNHEIRDYVDKLTNRLWDEKNLKGTAPMIISRRREALRKIAWIISQNEPDDIDIPSPPKVEKIPKTGGPLDEVDKQWAEFEEKMLEHLKLVSKRKFRDYVMIEEGGKRMERMLRPYFHLDSGWRDDSYDVPLRAAYEHGDKYFLASRLRKKGEAYFFNPKRKPEAKGDLIKELEYVAKYRPQSIAEFFYDGESDAFGDWFTKNQEKLRFEYPDQLFKAVNRRFVMLNELFMRDNLEPIDYSQFADGFDPSKLTEEQRAIVDRVFGIKLGEGNIDDSHQYFDAMRRLYKFVSGNVEELTKIQYDRFFLHIAWEDDLPVQYLEAPDETMQTRMKPEYWRDVLHRDDIEGRTLGFSQLFTESGAGPGSPLGRAWGDYGMAIDAFQELLPMDSPGIFEPDEKAFFKIFRDVWNKIDIYQGGPIATNGLIGAAAAWLGSAEVKVNYGEFLAWMDESSIFKEQFGANAPSLSLDKINELRENLDLVKGRLEYYAPEAAKHLDEFLRISTFHLFGVINTKLSVHRIFQATRVDKFVENVVPNIPFVGKYLGRVINQKLLDRIEKTAHLGLWEYKIRLAIALAAVVLIANAAEQARKGGKEAAQQ